VRTAVEQQTARRGRGGVAFGGGRRNLKGWKPVLAAGSGISRSGAGILDEAMDGVSAGMGVAAGKW
jgi:hypothetical protein